jgi:cystathionine beta-lyase
VFKNTKFDKIIERKNTNSIKYDGYKIYFGVDDAKPLWVADMDFATPKFIQKSFHKKLKQQIYGYEKVGEEFYNGIIYWQKKNEMNLVKDDIIFSDGVVSSISAAVRAFTKEGDGVLIQTPVYFPFYSCIERNNRELYKNDLRIIGNKYRIDFEDFESKIKKVKLFILCSPHNPLSKIWSKSELKKIVSICKKYNVLIISDEIHSDFCFKKFTSVYKYDKDAIILNSPTKTFNLAGIKTSYAISKNHINLKKLKYELLFSHNNMMNSFSNVAIKSAYSKKGKKWLSKLNKYLISNIKFTTKFFKNNYPNIKVKKSEATYLLWLDFKNTGLSHKNIKKKLLYGAKVVLNDGLSFGRSGYGYFRLNIALPKSELKKALKKIVKEFK